MKVAVVHNEVADHDAPDTRDVLQQVDAVIVALMALGHEAFSLACTLDLGRIKQQLTRLKPQLVFNLVESLGGHGSLIHLFPFLLEALHLSYTGSAAEVIRLTSHKTAAKKMMRRAGLPTPDWVEFNGAAGRVWPGKKASGSKVWIIKSLWEHASVGLGTDSLLQGISDDMLQAEMAKRAHALGGACFAEEFIDGREFNLSILAGEGGPMVLPPAEIRFEGFDPAKPRIVDYRAKWDESSFEYHHTPRQFVFSPGDGPLLKTLQELAQNCWEVFGLRGYARVDFRVDDDGQPWILEVNANPCLSPDAGFAAALARAGMPFNDAMAAILTDTGSLSSYRSLEPDGQCQNNRPGREKGPSAQEG